MQESIPTPNQFQNQSSQNQSGGMVSATGIQVPNSNRKIVTWKKFAIILACIGVATIVFVTVFFIVFASTSKKIECTSSRGDITIMYNDDGINGYAANGFEYNLDDQQTYAKSIGVEQYLDEFKDWFETNTNGTCVKK